MSFICRQKKAHLQEMGQMTTPSEKECVANTEGKSWRFQNEITRILEKHIFFLGGNMKGARTHRPPSPTQSQLSIVSSHAIRPTLPEGQTYALRTGNSLLVMTMQADAVPHRQLLNLRGGRVNNHQCYPFWYWLCLIYITYSISRLCIDISLLYIYIVTMICRYYGLYVFNK